MVIVNVTPQDEERVLFGTEVNTHLAYNWSA